MSYFSFLDKQKNDQEINAVETQRAIDAAPTSIAYNVGGKNYNYAGDDLEKIWADKTAADKKGKSWGKALEESIQEGGDFGQAVIDKVGGGFLRDAARIGGFVAQPFTHGKSDDAVEKFIADHMENVSQTGKGNGKSAKDALTRALNYDPNSAGGKAGVVAGTVSKAVADLAALKAASEFGSGLGGTKKVYDVATGTKEVAAIPFLSFLGGSAAAGTMADLQTRGQGNPANLPKDLAMGVVSDLGFKGIGKGLGYAKNALFNRGTEEAATRGIGDVISSGQADDIVNDFNRPKELPSGTRLALPSGLDREAPTIQGGESFSNALTGSTPETGFTIPEKQTAYDALRQKDNANRIAEIDKTISDAQQNGTKKSATQLRSLIRERAALNGETWMNEDAGLGTHTLEADLPDSARTVENAKESVASVNAPKVSSSTSAKDAVLGGADEGVDNSKSSFVKGAENIFQHLNNQAKEYDANLSAPEAVAKHLENSEAVKTAARKNSWLNHYEDTLSVLGRHFGKVGTDIGYKLAQGAKLVSDIQEHFRPDVAQLTKFTKSLKSSAAKSDVGGRIEQALEDRANSGKYLKTDEEKKIYQTIADTLDWFKQKRIDTGRAVIGENYSPRAMIKDALDTPDRLLRDARSAFSDDATSQFSKQRTKTENLSNANILDLMPRYIASQAKEFAYSDALKYAKENLSKVNPEYLTDNNSVRNGEKYLGTLFQQVLDPPNVSKWERLQNAMIAQTYKAQLKFSPKFALTNSTQAYATKTQISKEASKIVGKIDKGVFEDLQKGLTSGTNPITEELANSADSIGGVSTRDGSGSLLDHFRDIGDKISKADPGSKSEERNVKGAFNRGVTQQLLDSSEYKAAIKAGKSETEAAREALANPEVKDLAIRRGNIVVNDTQFGSNFVIKPEFFRESGTLFGLSRKWFTQYQRFPQGMIQNISTIMRGNDARALDILKRGNAAETGIVDYLHSAKALQNGAKDLIKGVKDGSIHDVSLEVAQGYHDSLGKAINSLNKEIKANSQIRSGKTAKNFAKMWVAASTIQFLFDGGLSMNEEDRNKELSKAAVYGAPVNVPTRESLGGIAAPSSPIRPNGRIDKKKFLNFIPVVGPAVNRYNDVKKVIGALTGN